MTLRFVSTPGTVRPQERKKKKKVKRKSVHDNESRQSRNSYRKIDGSFASGDKILYGGGGSTSLELL